MRTILWIGLGVSVLWALAWSLVGAPVPAWPVPGFSAAQGPPTVLEVRVRTVFDAPNPGLASASEDPMPADVDGGVRVWIRSEWRSGETPARRWEGGIRRLPGEVAVLDGSPHFAGLPLEVVRTFEDDGLVVRVDRELVALSPGEERGLGILPEDGGYRLVTEEAHWRRALEGALERAKPAAVLWLENRGPGDSGTGEGGNGS